MNILAYFLVGLVAALHLWFLVLQMFLWTTDRGRRAFVDLSPAEAKTTAVLAGNMGLTNGFIALGLTYGLLDGDPAVGPNFVYFFLFFALVAGLYGWKTFSRKVAYFQAAPAAAALAAYFFR